MKERELNFVNSLNNRVRKRYYCDDSGEINSIPLEENDQVYIINSNQLYQIESINEEEQLSGKITNFGGRNNTKIESLEVGIEPVQDLHGYDSPWPAGSAYNKLPCPTAFTETSNGITLASDGIGQYTLKGTATAAFEHKFNIPETVLPDTVYIHLLNSAGGSSNGSINIDFYNGNTRVDYIGFSTVVNRKYNGTTTLGGKTINAISIRVANAETISGTLTFSPMALTANDTVAFIPYSNICPISGWTEAKVWRTGKNLLDYSAFQQYSNWSGNLIPYGAYLTSFDKKGYFLSTIPGMTHTISLGITSTSSPEYCYLCRGNGVDTSERVMAFSTDLFARNAITFTAENGWIYYIRMGKTNNQALFDGQISKISYAQLELGSTPTAYEPYSGNQYTLQLGQTVYGGTLDVTGGKMVVSHAVVKLGNWMKSLISNYSSKNGYYYNGVNLTPPMASGSFYSDPDTICSHFAKKPNADSGMGMWIGANSTYFYFAHVTENIPNIETSAKFCEWLEANDVFMTYPLATPITIPLTPTEITTLLGTNNLWANTGEIKTLDVSTKGKNIFVLAPPKT